MLPLPSVPGGIVVVALAAFHHAIGAAGRPGLLHHVHVDGPVPPLDVVRHGGAVAAASGGHGALPAAARGDAVATQRRLERS